MSSDTVVTTVELQYPITVKVGEAEQRLSTLGLRRLKIGALRELERRQKAGEIAGDIDEALYFIECMTGLSPEAVDQLDPEDLHAVNAAVEEVAPRGKEATAGSDK